MKFMNYSEITFGQLVERLMQHDLQAIEEMLYRFDRYILNQSKINGVVDDDVAQQVRQAFWIALKQKFKF